MSRATFPNLGKIAWGTGGGTKGLSLVGAEKNREEAETHVTGELRSHDQAGGGEGTEKRSKRKTLATGGPSFRLEKP